MKKKVVALLVLSLCLSLLPTTALAESSGGSVSGGGTFTLMRAQGWLRAAMRA